METEKRSCQTCRGTGLIRGTFNGKEIASRCKDCHGFGYMIYPKLPPLRQSAAESNRKALQRVTVIQQNRKADAQCVQCGSPNLATRNHCARCRDQINARNRISL